MIWITLKTKLVKIILKANLGQIQIILNRKIMYIKKILIIINKI